MAIDALPHTPYFVGQTLQVFHVTVAFPARDLTVDMALMVEQYMLGHIIYFDPGGGCLGIKIAMLDFNPRVIGNDVIVAVQAFFYRRDSRMVGIGHIGVAILALDLFNAAVNVMTEGNRLLGADAGCRGGIEQINKASREYYRQKCQNNGYCIFFQRLSSLLTNRP